MTDPIIKRGTIRSVIGVEVDTLDVQLLVNEDVEVQGVPLAQFAREGGFDGARMTLSRSFSAHPWSASCGSLSLFSGRVSDVSLTGSAVSLQVSSDLELLNVMMPRNIYQASCVHTLYDSGCGLVAANFTVTSAVAANSTRSIIYCNLAQADGYFDLGTLAFTSGDSNGIRRTVKLYTTGAIVPIPPLVVTPTPGDTFTIKPGCDKSMATCNSSKFSNLANFKGFPLIPVTEAGF